MNHGPTTSNPQEPAIDRQVLDSLLELGGNDDPGLFDELLNLFLSDTPERLRAIEESFQSKSAEGVERSAHALKSGSAQVGAGRLSALCKEIELLARSSSFGPLASAIPRLRGEFERVDAYLRALLQSRAGQSPPAPGSAR